MHESSLNDVDVSHVDGPSVSAQLELDKCQKWFKWTLMGFNIVQMIFACVLCAVGSYALSGKAESLSGVTLPAGIITFGVFFLLLSFLGCFAAFRESRPLLAGYFFIVLLFCMMMFFIGISVLVHKNDAEKYMENGWIDASNDVRLSLQNYFECCGLRSNSTDPTAQNTFEGIPCNAAYKDPCLPILTDKFYKDFDAAGGSGVAFAILLAFYMAACISLYRAVGRRRKLLGKLDDSAPSNNDLRRRDDEPVVNTGSTNADGRLTHQRDQRELDVHSFDNEY